VLKPFTDKANAVRGTDYTVTIYLLIARDCNVEGWFYSIYVSVCVTVYMCVSANGHKAVFKTQYLPTATILQEFNKLCQEHDLKKPAQQ